MSKDNLQSAKHSKSSILLQRVGLWLLKPWNFIGLCALLIVIFIAWPLPKSLTQPYAEQSVRVTDRHGTLLYEARQGLQGSKDILPLSGIPKPFIEALLSIEDRDFYSHGGVSVKAIVRAFVQNIQSGRVVSGGSTITQQYVRSQLKPKKRTVFYKIREAIVAVKLEWVMSKDVILEAYINNAYFGHQAYGLAAAARTYFAKSPQELSTGEYAMLAGLVQAPTNLDLFKSTKDALARRTRVLDAMKINNVLDDKTYTEANDAPLHIATGRIPIKAPHFVMWMLGKEEATNSHELHTTLDLPLQEQAEAIVTRQLASLAEKNVTSAAVVVLDAKTGELLAMVGSADYFDTEHDGAVNVAVAERQPGSALKPFTYALAMSAGDTAATTVADIETQFFTQDGNPYIPRNYDYGYHGLVRYREALANSYNIAAVKVLQKVGVPTLQAFLQQAGLTTLIQSPEHYGLALTLGSAEVKLLELTKAYGLFARAGKTLPVQTLMNQENQDFGQQLVDPRIAWLITDILSDDKARLQEFGEDSALNFPYPVAAKTGTTRNSRDNWTIGYTQDRIVGVWVGNADNTPMKGTSGVTGAGPIFHDVMDAAMSGRAKTDFVRPQGITEKTICRLSGMLPTDACPTTINEYFLAGTEPTKTDTLYQTLLIDTRNGLRASAQCKEFTVQKTFIVFPVELRTWARENGYEEPPAQLSPLCGDQSTGDATADLSITSPHPETEYLLDPIIPDEHEKIIFQANAPITLETVEWFVDGKLVGSGKAPTYRFEWQPVVGSHTVEVRSATNKASVRFRVIKPN